MTYQLFYIIYIVRYLWSEFVIHCSLSNDQILKGLICKVHIGTVNNNKMRANC